MATKAGELVNDLSKGVVPVMAVIGILGFIWAAATWVANTTGQTGSMGENFKLLSIKVDQLSMQVNTLSIALAQGPKLPDNVVFRADLLEFCLLNPKLNCPFKRNN